MALKNLKKLNLTLILVKVKAFVWCIVLILIALGSCTTSTLDANTNAIGTDYYPVQVGSTWLYKVSRINTLFSGEIDTINYQVQEVVVDSVINATNTTYTVQSSRRDNNFAVWESDTVFQYIKTGTSLATFRNNRQVTIMAFPVRKGAQWVAENYSAIDGSAKYNYTYSKVGVPTTVETMLYPITLTITQQADSNCKYKVLNYDIIAKGKGRVLTNRESYSYKEPCNPQPIIELGYKEIKTLVSYVKK